MRKIALITTSRADYGIQARLIAMLRDDPEICFTLVVSGSHLSTKHGLTVKEIENDGISDYIPVDLAIDEEADVAKIMSRALTGFSDVLVGLHPDICVLLGDRYEMLAGALACAINGIPVAHIHGGETTAGANDEIFRHSLTKAAHLHFTSCEEYRRRVIQLGESPDRVFNVGALGVENIMRIPLMTRQEVEGKIGAPLGRRNFLVTYHPVTIEGGAALGQIREVLSALDEMEGADFFFTRPNADAEGDVIAMEIDRFVRDHANAHYYASLGSRLYLSLVKNMDAVIGNSSSGIIEVPSLKIPTVNIGDRQLGRISADSVANCSPRKDEIVSTIKAVLSDEFISRVQSSKNPYEKSGTAEAILSILKSFNLQGICKKRFYDIKDFKI